jgi:ABC-type transport system involved in cytochrome bd biosynthesis fused ATPase/permease subunit
MGQNFQKYFSAFLPQTGNMGVFTACTVEAILFFIFILSFSNINKHHGLN